MNELIHGDCLEIMDYIGSESIDLILCDLPYGTTNCKWDSVIPFAELWKHYERIIKLNGAILLTSAEPFTSYLITSNIKLFKYDLIWQKTHPKGHLNAKKMPMRAHENICVFYKKPPVYNPQKTTGHKHRIIPAKYKKENIGNNVYGSENRNTHYDSTERYPLSVQVFGNADLTKLIHPTEKPVSLFEWLIKTYSNKGDTVLDNCSGSGTTAIACINTGRKYICIEKDKNYYDLSKHRILNHQLSI